MENKGYAYYEYNDEAVIIVRTETKEDTYEVEKFNGIKAVEEAVGYAVLRISDIEAKGIKITNDDVCLSYDDTYCSGYSKETMDKGIPIIRAEVPNVENEQVMVDVFVTECYIR